MVIVCEKCGHKNEVEPRRRPSHSRITHKAIAYVAAALGEDPAHTKVLMKLRAGAWEPYPFAEPPEWPGRFVADEWVYDITGFPAVFLKSESAYDKVEERQLLATIRGYAEANHVDMGWLDD